MSGVILTGKRSESPEVRELLDAIRQLLEFNRGGTLDAEQGEWGAYKRAKRLLDRYERSE